MAQVTWRAADDLVDRVRRRAADEGRSMNDFVTAVLDAVTDPDTAGSERAQLRERLRRAGLLYEPEPSQRRRRPPRTEVERAGKIVGRGEPLVSDIVSQLRGPP